MNNYLKRCTVITGNLARSGLDLILENAEKFVEVATYPKTRDSTCTIKENCQTEIIVLELDLTLLSETDGTLTVIKTNDGSLDVIILPVYNSVDNAFVDGFSNDDNGYLVRNAQRGLLEVHKQPGSRRRKKNVRPFPRNLNFPIDAKEMRVLKLLIEQAPVSEFTKALKIAEEDIEKCVRNISRKLIACSGYRWPKWLNQ
jgi:hypothetical protein